MTAIVSQNFRVVNADNFKEDVKNSNVYVGIGKADAWSTSTADTTDTTPTVPSDHLDDQAAARYQMIGMQKLTAADVSHVVKRHNWTTGTVYEPYDSNVADLYDKNPCFYVLTNEFKVYKCIDNNDGAQSTVQPIHTTPTPAGSATDGYVWKYMYTITTADSEKFLTTAFMPVKTVPITIDVTTAATAATGQDKILLTEANLDIKVGHRVKNGNTVVGEVQAISGAQLDLLANISGSAIAAGTKLTLDFANDTKASTALSTDFVQYKAQKDSLELAEAGGIERIEVLTGGAGYTSAPTTFNIHGDGENAAVAAGDVTIAGGAITGVKIGTATSGSNHGSDYTIASFELAGGGASTQATLRAVISPPQGHGVDPVAELGGFLVSLNTQLVGSGGADSDLTIGNDFRQISIIKNPRVHDSNAYGGALATATTLNPLKVLNIDNSGNAGLFAADDVITGTSGAKAFVAKVDTEGSNNKIFYYQNFKTGFEEFGTGSGEKITAQDGAGTAAEFVASKGNPDVDRRTGEFLFLENRNPINRSATQIEDIKLILEF